MIEGSSSTRRISSEDILFILYTYLTGLVPVYRDLSGFELINQRHNFDLDQRSFGQPCHGDGAARGWVFRKELGINAVHLCEIVHVLEEYRGLDDIGNARPGCLENILQVLQGLARLAFDIVRNKLARGR